MKKQRLLKLADHLERGKLIHDKFNFRQVHLVQNCGTCGCAMGEMPALWPKECQLGGINELILGGVTLGPFSGLSRTVAEFFGVEEKQVNFLFFPRGHGDLVRHNGLLPGANRRHVATRIRKFVKLGHTY